jgi:hypothetical protein
VQALLDDPVAGGTMILVLGVLVVLLVVTRIGELRWRALGLDLDGKRPPEDDPEPEAEPR